MPKYIIERNLPGSNKFTAVQLQEIAQESCDVLIGMGPQIQWLHSYITPNKWYCVYIAPDKETIREHARRGGFPADAVHEVVAMTDPVHAENFIQRT